MVVSKVFFSIIIPTYNRAHLIEKTIKSVLNQTYQNFEIIIVDDGSTDNTKEVVGKFLNENIFYHYKKNEERAVARNYGTKLAKGNYINWFDSDDIMLPNHLEEAFKTILKTNAQVYSTGYLIVDENNKTLFKSNLSGIVNNKLYQGNFFSCNAVFVQKEIAEKYFFNKNRDLSGSEDYELWLRIAANYKIFANNTITFHLIQHDERSVLSMRKVEQLEKRFLLFLELTLNNLEIISLLKNKKGYFKMKNYFLLSVELAVIGAKLKSTKYLLKGVFSSCFFISNRSFYAILKHLMSGLLKKN